MRERIEHIKEKMDLLVDTNNCYFVKSIDSSHKTYMTDEYKWQLPDAKVNY